MNKIDMDKIIFESIKSIQEFYNNKNNQDELAYLALTSKIELPVRDKIAWYLYNRLGNEYIVSREYPVGRKRIDIAILDKKGSPFIYIEFKAMYTFDCIQTSRGRIPDNYQKALIKDIQKCNANDDIIKTYAVLLATHPHKSIPREYTKTIKYAGSINKNLGKKDNIEIYEECDENLKNYFNGLVSGAIMKDGEALKNVVDVYYWMLGPLSKKEPT